MGLPTRGTCPCFRFLAPKPSRNSSAAKVELASAGHGMRNPPRRSTDNVAERKAKVPAGRAVHTKVGPRSSHRFLARLERGSERSPRVAAQHQSELRTERKFATGPRRKLEAGRERDAERDGANALGALERSGGLCR